MKPEAMNIIKRTVYKAERPEGQADLGTGPEVYAAADEAYDFRQDIHRKDIMSIMARVLMRSYGHESAAGIMRQDLETVLAKLDPERPAEQPKEEQTEGGIVWPTGEGDS